MKSSLLARAGCTLGLGLGGFFDGIVLHQILGWHHLICTTATCQAPTVEHLRRQNTQDGCFHFAVWCLTLLGIYLLFRAGTRLSERWSGQVLAGSIIAGWGLFNLVEGVIDHQLLGIHHVLPGSPHWFLFDLLFLASGVLLIIGGWFVARARSSVLTGRR